MRRKLMGLHTSDEIEDGIVYETTVDESGKFEVATSDIRPSSDYDDRQKTTRKPRQIKSPEAEAKSTTEPTKAPVADPALEIPAAYAEIADRINKADQECKINWALETAEIDIKDEAQLEELRNLAEFRRQQIRKAN